MLEWRMGGSIWRLSLLFPATVVLVLTLDSSGLAAWCLAASVMHECGHLLALFLCGGHPLRVTIGLFGMRMEQDGSVMLSYPKSLLVSVAGPLVNLLTAAMLLPGLGWQSPPVLVHASMAVFNLLPLEPLDGGQALFALLAVWRNEQTADRIVLGVSVAVLLPLAAAGFFVLLQSGYNFTLLAVTVYIGLLLLCKHKR